MFNKKYYQAMGVIDCLIDSCRNAMEAYEKNICEHPELRNSGYTKEKDYWQDRLKAYEFVRAEIEQFCEN